jgi:hypothetical protein
MLPWFLTSVKAEKMVLENKYAIFTLSLENGILGVLNIKPKCPNLVIPSSFEINGVVIPVKEIGVPTGEESDVLRDKSLLSVFSADSLPLKIVKIPDSVIVNPGAFFRSRVDRFIIPDSVEIKSGAFEDSFVEGLEFPTGGPESLDGFEKCNLFQIVIPSRVRSVPPRAFAFNRNLTLIVVPKNVESLSGFNGCSRLLRIFFEEGSNLRTLGENAFQGCVSLKEVPLCDTPQLSTIESRAFEGSGLEKVIIPANVKELSSGSFRECQKLVNVIFDPQGNLEKIGNRTFSGCKLLTKVLFPRSLAEIGDHAFEGSGLGEVFFVGETDTPVGIASRAFSKGLKIIYTQRPIEPIFGNLKILEAFKLLSASRPRRTVYLSDVPREFGETLSKVFVVNEEKVLKFKRREMMFH